MGSLFSGIAGLELGLAAAFEEAGFEVEIKWQVEQDPDCRAVLQKHYPTVDRSITDVRIASRANLVRVGLICGGFPCQDVSGAGKGAGLAGARSGLWFEFLRIVSELHPPLVIVENVASGAKRWLCRVRADLHALGYRTRAIALSAADVGAPHLRRRIFIIAVADAHGGRSQGERGARLLDGKRAALGHDSHGCGGEMAYPDARGRDERTGAGGELARLPQPADGDQLAHLIGELVRVQPGRRGGPDGAGAPEPGDAREMAHPDLSRLEGRGQPEPRGADERASGESGAARPDDHGQGGAESCVGRIVDGLSPQLDSHRWPTGRGKEQHPEEAPRAIEGKQARRRQRLKALGNAVMPQQALVIGRMVVEMINE